MKTVFALISLTMGVFAQNSAVSGTQAACGPKGVDFEVQNDDTRHSIAQPEAGKALIYVIQDDGPGKCLACATTRVGLDGAWIGANRHNSYVSFAVDPGEHHLCVTLQAALVSSRRFVSLAHLNAEARKVYFFRTRTPADGRPYVDLEPVDSDQAKFLVAEFPASTSHLKK